MLLIIAMSSGYAQHIGDGFAPEINDLTVPLKSGVYNPNSGNGSSPDTSHTWDHLLVIRHPNQTKNYQFQLSSSITNNDRLFFRKIGNENLAPSNTNWFELATRGTNTFTGNQTINGNQYTSGSGSFQGLTSSIDSNEGGSISIVNPSKNSTGTASKWKLYNMTGGYGNSLQFYAIANTCGDSFCGPRMTLLDSGNVGIGTTTPNAKLEVNGNILVGGLGAGSDAVPLSKKIAAFNYQKIEAGAIDFLDFNTTRHSTSIAFRAKNASNVPQEFMRIVGENGNVGIGTTNPTQKLEVIGNAKISGKLTLGLDTQITTISGPANGGAIQIKPNALAGGGDNRYLRLGLIDNNSVFYPAISVADGLNVGIGTTNPDQKLTVKGKIHTEEVIVDLLVPADYVFQKYYTGKSALKADYTMPTLAEIETYTKQNHHLPNVPSANEIKEKGLQLGEMSNILLQKIEELTIYVIEQNKKLNEQQKEIEQLKKEVRK